jgi:hypothetical protein
MALRQTCHRKYQDRHPWAMSSANRHFVRLAHLSPYFSLILIVSALVESMPEPKWYYQWLRVPNHHGQHWATAGKRVDTDEALRPATRKLAS